MKMEQSLTQTKSVGQLKIEELSTRVNARIEARENPDDVLRDVTQGLPERWVNEIKNDLNPAKKVLTDQERDAKYLIPLANEKVPTLASNEVSSYIESIRKISSDVYFKNRNHLSDEMFMVSKGAIEHEDGTSSVFKKVPGDIGELFDAHGIDKGDQLSSLLALLDSGIDSSRTFFTAPFELPDEKKAAMGAAIGTGGGTAYKGGLAVLLSGAKESLSKDGIKHVFINDVYGKIVEPLQKAYPKYSFHLLS
jgi:hypothetical protein